MNIEFGFFLDQKYLKDRWGYKTDTLEPNVFYGYIDCEINLDNKPQSQSAFTQQDQLLCDLLNHAPPLTADFARRIISGEFV